VADDASTLLVERAGALPVVSAPRFSLEIIHGPDSGATAPSVAGRLTIGTAEGVDLRLGDPTVSRYHAELEATARGIVVRDLGSTNGTQLAGALVREVTVRGEVELRFGKTRARLALVGAREEVEASRKTAFGGLIGSSTALRRVYNLLERAAPTTAPVLITGESGTGKELAARALHDASARRSGPFEVVDCGGLPPTLIESELFGHERGAFTNATHDREGAFERADGGTLFLDELGELPLELQPKLLRALGESEVRRIGSRAARKVDVRLVAATNRDLRREVNAGTFRSDVFYRLAVIQVHLPPLRERLEDLPMLVRALLERIVADRRVPADIEPDGELVASLARHAWPGNVRELRNYLEQLVILRVPPELPTAVARPAAGGDPYAVLHALPLREAKQELVERFERGYLEALLDATQGNVAEAARRAGVDRGTLFRTIRRYGIKVER
jgi:two-component system response regulator GlrR